MSAAPNAPILVNVFLPGGCDLLSTLTPLWQAGPLNDLRKTLGPIDTPPVGLGDRQLQLVGAEGALLALRGGQSRRRILVIGDGAVGLLLRVLQR